MTKEEREKEIERVVALLPQQPDAPKAAVRLMEERGLLKGDVIVYKCDMFYDPLQDRRRQGVICHCSACGDSWWTEKVAAGPTTGCSRAMHSIGFENLDGEVWSGNDTMCPQCGAEVQARHISAFGAAAESHIDGDHCLTVHETGGHLAVLDWYVERRVDRTGGIHTHFHGYEGCVVIDGTYYRVSGHSRTMGGGDCWYQWTRRKGRVYDLTAVCKGSQLIPFADELVARTDADKSGFEDYCRSVNDSDGFLPCSYLQLWCQFPQAENIVRTGNARFVSELIVASQVESGSYWTAYEHFSPSETKHYADWKKVRPNEILHIGKEDYKRLAGRPFNEINLFQQVSDVFGVRISDELLNMAKYCGTDELRDILSAREKYGRRVSPEKVIRYCFANKRQAKSGFRPNDLLDHWRIVAAYYGELPESLMYPKRFAEVHRKFSDLLTASGQNKWDADVAMQADVMMKYAWGDPETGLRIFPAKSETELKNEGKALNHCVGSYAESMARGETTIFFIRRIRDQKTPYFTLEFKNGAVEQNRGKKNCGRTPDVEVFEKKWIAHVKEVDAVLKKMKQEEKQRGKSDANGKRGDDAA